MAQPVLFKEVEVFDIFRLDGELLVRYNSATDKATPNCKVCNINGLASRGEWRRVADDTMVELIQKMDSELLKELF